jgi:uncharacterized protein YjbI with pentapeptide repeats
VDQQAQSRWRTTGSQVLWGIVIALVVLILIGYAFPWTGFGQSKVNGEIQPYKTLWDWLDLLIVPVVLAIGGYLFNSSQNQATRRAAERRAQDDALEAYLDDMSDLITPKKDQPSMSDERPPDSLKSVARARTVTLLARLDEGLDEGEKSLGKGSVLRFLSESGLLRKGTNFWEEPVVSIQGADLRRADLRGTDLKNADLHLARLNGSELFRANLNNADLRLADLSGASLRNVTMCGADLSGADLSKANLREANLSNGKVYYDNPQNVRMMGDLFGEDLQSELTERLAPLSGADLSGARGVDNEELDQQASSLEGATMPNGQKYEDWLKSKGHGEDGENSGTSNSG